MNARSIFGEVAEISHLAMQMAEAGRRAGLHNIALFSKMPPSADERAVIQKPEEKMRDTERDEGGWLKA